MIYIVTFCLKEYLRFVSEIGFQQMTLKNCKISNKTEKTVKRTLRKNQSCKVKKYQIITLQKEDKK